MTHKKFFFRVLTLPLLAAKIVAVVVAFTVIQHPLAAQRKMVHPGISYTQADIDRMRAMIAAKQEPFYTAFQYLLNDRYTTYKDYDVEMLKDSNGRPSLWFDESKNVYRQYWFGQRGQIALNNALLWKLTDDTRYAEKAKTVLNSYIGIHSTVTYGTNCLDNAACTPLIEAAELLRDYEGWDAADQQGFKDFLVYPGYSSKESYYAKYSTSDPATSECTVYWNIFMGDPGRHGNQGLYGMRCMMAMGIYLDNDTIYERALNKVLSRGHRPDDLPYNYGPFKSTGWTASDMPEYHWNQSTNTKDARFDWLKHGDTFGDVTIGDSVDYGADDELKWWIYDNGQCQESARDQGHVMDGMCNMTEIAKVAWNQGDDIFTQYDDRLLKGLNYAIRYNYTWRNNHYDRGNYFDADDFEPTVENGQFYSIKSHNNGFWSKKICPYSESSKDSWSRGKMLDTPLQMLMAYQVRLGRDADSCRWLQRAWSMMRDTLRTLGAAKLSASKCMLPEELTEYRTVWMAGDAGTFADKQHMSGIPNMPGEIKAVDYDFFSNSISGQSHTYYTSATRTDKLYRLEGGMPIAEDAGSYVLTDMTDGSWMNYTFSVPTTTVYDITVSARVKKAGSKIGFAIDGGEAVMTEVEKNDGYSDISLGSIKIKAGARVIRIYVAGTDGAVSLESIKITEGAVSEFPTDYEWNSLDYSPTAGKGMFLNDQSSKSLYSTEYASTSQAVFTLASSAMNYYVGTDKLYLVMKGRNLDHAAMTSASYQLDLTSQQATKNSSNGLPNQLSTTDRDGATVCVWKLDSTANARLKPLLIEPYSSSNDRYILRGLTFLVYGTSLYKQTEIGGIEFYTLNEIKQLYPELFTADGITELPTKSSEAASECIYDLSGRAVCQDNLVKGIYVKNNQKFIVK